jgi:mersacidin/lichenicidin family type 2 lantibiotic
MDASDQQVAKDTIVRAWADEEFCASLPEELRREIPARPLDGTGAVLSDQELETAAGAGTPAAVAVVAVRAAASKAAPQAAKFSGKAGAAGFFGAAGVSAWNTLTD